MQRLGCTPEEAKAVVDFIEQQGDDGQPIRRIIPWVKNRPDRDLSRDLAHVRKFADAPPMVGVCSEHGVSLEPGWCQSCEGDMSAGDFDTVRKILERDGADARPDLARRLGAPQTPAGTSYYDDPGKAMRSWSKSGHTPFKNPVDQSAYDDDLIPRTRPSTTDLRVQAAKDAARELQAELNAAGANW